jgi:tetratricopeptide (TPR) repeat protein
MEKVAYIDSYFRGELSPEESLSFDQQIKDDPSFAAEVAFYCSTLQVMKDEVTAEKKQRFRELYARTKQPPAIIKRWRPFMAAAAILAALLIGWYLYMQPPPLQDVADRYIKETFETVSVRMAVTEDSLDMAKRLYNEKKLPESLVVFEKLSRSDSASDEAKKMAGIVSMRLKQYDKAIKYFTSLEQLTLYDNPGKLYHALALIKRNQPGDKENAKQLLQQVVVLEPAQKETAVKWLQAF